MLHPAHLGVSLRTRLTLWYGALLALTLLGFSALLYFTLERSLAASVDEALHLRADQIRRSVLGPNIGILLQPDDVPPGQVDARPLEEFAAPGIYVQLLNGRGGILLASSNLSGGELPVTGSIVSAMRAGQETLLTVPVGDANVRVLSVPLRASRDVVGAIQVGQSLSPLESTMTAVARVLFAAGAAALLVATVAGWVFTRRALNPVARITATARHIAATGDYRQRIPVAQPHVGPGDELFFLASTFNDMINRLEQLLESHRRLLADTSHELRNPLTVIRGNLALLRREGVPAATCREAILEAEEEAARMGRLVNELLLLARADAGQTLSLDLEPVDLAEVARDVVEQSRARAGGHRLEVLVDRPAVVRGDRDRLRQLVANLVGNAVRYTPEPGHIRVRVGVEPAQGAQDPAALAVQHRAAVDRSPSVSPDAAVPTAFLTVTDSGIGIAPEHLPHVFERFYRADRARSRGDGGTGLGLPIAQYIAQLHGGRIVALSAGAGRGSTFRVTLPLASAVAPAAATTGRRRRRPVLTEAEIAPQPAPATSEGLAR